MSKEKFIILGTLSALALFVVFVIMPSWDVLNVDRVTLSYRQSALEQAKSLNQKIEELNSQYTNEELESVLSVLPKQEELSALLIQLERLATGNGLIMESVNFSKIEQPPAAQESQPAPESENVTPDVGQITLQENPTTPYKVLLVSLKLSGGYDAFKSYLQAVEKNLRLMDVTSLSLSSAGTSQNFFFTVNLRVYYQ